MDSQKETYRSSHYGTMCSQSKVYPKAHKASQKHASNNLISGSLYLSLWMESPLGQDLGVANPTAPHPPTERGILTGPRINKGLRTRVPHPLQEILVPVSFYLVTNCDPGEREVRDSEEELEREFFRLCRRKLFFSKYPVPLSLLSVGKGKSVPYNPTKRDKGGLSWEVRILRNLPGCKK